MNRRVSIGVAVALVLIAVTITFTATMIFSMRLFDQKVLSVKERAAMYTKLSEIDSVVRGNLYFTIDEQKLYDSIAKGYVSGLGDRDTSYLSQSDLIKRDEAAEGTKISAGFESEVNINGYMVVTQLYSGKSAEQLGLLEGDTVVKINGEDVKEIGYENAVAALQGEVGTKLELTYSRDAEETTIEVTRELIETTSVYYSSELDGFGYIRIKYFNNTTLAQFEQAIATATADSEIKGLVFDVRDTNGGNNLDSVGAMLDILLPTGSIISGTYADGSNKVLYTSDEDSVSLPMVILVNENTHGFAELFAGVLSESGNCRVIGKTTYGKGTLQQLTKLSDGSAIDQTVAILNLPVSGSYDRIGIKPEYDVDVEEGFTFSDVTPSETRDPQMQKAVEIIRSMTR